MFTHFKMKKTLVAFVSESQESELKLNEIEVEYHPECPVCLQSCNYPVQLPCGHIFCYLCIKGVALRSRRCALCRQNITVDCIENPTLVKPVNIQKEKEGKDEETEKDQTFVWYYEGRNGWWQYDEKTSSEVEKAFKSGKRSCQLLIAGFLYSIDFESMFQMRRNEPGRMRRIKRDKPDAEKKGVAGIRLPVKAKPKSAAETKTTEKSSSAQNCSSDSDRETKSCTSEDNSKKSTPSQGISQDSQGSTSQQQDPQTSNVKDPSSSQEKEIKGSNAESEKTHHDSSATGKE